MRNKHPLPCRIEPSPHYQPQNIPQKTEILLYYPYDISRLSSAYALPTLRL